MPIPTPKAIKVAMRPFHSTRLLAPMRSFMPLIWSSCGASFLLTALVIAGLCVVGPEKRFNQANQAEQAKLGKLGTVNFPISCSQPAQARFLRGVAALHSFWYPVALEEFRESTKIEPDCMMGYWGEAMAHNHPIWGDPQETEVARKAIEKLRYTPKLTPRARAWLPPV